MNVSAVMISGWWGYEGFFIFCLMIFPGSSRYDHLLHIIREINIIDYLKIYAYLNGDYLYISKPT